MNRDLWKNLKLKRGVSPELTCPTCNKGNLLPITDSLKYTETKESKSLHNYEDWDHNWISYRFTLHLKCDNTKCEDIVICSGTGYEDYDMHYNQKNDDWYEVTVSIFTPLYFIPALKIIPLNSSYPKEIVVELENSFAHFFSDIPACANKIRICIETLMDELNVKKTSLSSGKRKNLTLHNRILEYKRQNAEIADYLLAIKWIGNTGSHNKELTKDDILDAYYILDYSLNKIYDIKEEQVKKLTKQINKKKAPLSKNKKSKK